MVHHQRFLYTAVVKQDGTVEIRRKMSDLVAGHTSYVGAVNNAVTGITSIRPTTTVSMAVSRVGALHITWGRYYYPNFFRQYYRCYR